jgi:hypothetical protein
MAVRGIRGGASNSARTGSGSALGSQIQWSVTWPEDRATRRRDPSAAPGAKTGDGAPRQHPEGVPFLLLLSGIGADAINLGGPGGQSPPALASADDLLVNVSCVVCVWSVGSFGLNRGPLFAGSIAVVLFVRNTDPASRQGDSRTRLHPDTSLREFESRTSSSRAVLGESGTDHFSYDRPVSQGCLNHCDVGSRGRVCARPSRSKCHLRLTLAAGAERHVAFRRCNRLACFSRRRRTPSDSSERDVIPMASIRRRS